MGLVRSCLSVWAMVLLLPNHAAAAEKFSSAEGRFTVTVPARPTHEKSAVQTSSGPMVIHNFTVATADGQFILGYCDLPTGVPRPERIDTTLDGAVNGMVANTKGTLLKSETIHVDGFPGRDVHWSLRSNTGETQGRGRILLVGNRMYQVLAIGKPAFVGSKPVVEYVKGFAFDPPPRKQVSTPLDVSNPSGPGASRIPPPTGWYHFWADSNDGPFSVQAPSKPERKRAAGSPGINSATTFTFIADGLTFTILVQPVPLGALKDGEPAVLAAARDALATEHKGKTVGDRSIRIGDFPAREFRVTSSSLRPNVIQARAVVADRRLYTVSVTGPEAAVAGASARKFLDSFSPTP